MDLLLDTHVFIWWDERDRRLEESAVAAVANADNRVFVSAASIWEISIKRMLGKLRFRPDAVEAVRLNGFEPLGITLQHADISGSLPLYHTDPFDRLLVAQAKVEGFVLVTQDRRLVPYGVPILGVV